MRAAFAGHDRQAPRLPEAMSRSTWTAGHTAAFSAYEAEPRPYGADDRAEGRQAAATFGGGGGSADAGPA
ncbi:hypothetical protein [Actinoallomurus iriomotensis]|uniref:Uncharacterized protein n=1 Tax=Actinoallomurus iriomotensis TaxID=478107 RepID=A0A9W6RB95_9ACTN|nr:hypothetical protein [Actinoallomurus iriomotensis]GLY72751.1 hypothetical protein Airi01_010180 [Actinoallomurus iriomotensis]